MSKEFDIGEILPVPETYVHCSICKESYVSDKKDLNSYYNANVCPRCKQAILYARTLEEVFMNIKDVYKNLYPLTIVMDRYNGVYSGGRFTAWNLDPDEVPEEICGDDGSALEIFQNIRNGKRNVVYGVGATPDEAAMDLYMKIK